MLTMYGYGYEENIEISSEQLLQKVTQQEIFSWILNEPFDISSRYISPFRDDKRPNCRFEEKVDGTILFVDFGEGLGSGKTHRTCFKMVMDKFNIPYQMAIKAICNHFGLSHNPIDYEPVQVKQTTETSSNNSYPTNITWDVRPIEKKDKLFWSRFLITPQNLKEDKTGIVSRVHIDSRKGKKSFNPISLCYAFPISNHVKLYQPYNNPNYKWITNCDENDIGNFENFPLIGKELILSKSYKDHRVIRNADFGQTVGWTMNEGCLPHAKILLDLSQRFDLITIFYDNDQVGREAAEKLRNHILSINPQAKVRCVWLPVRKYPHKDPGEFISKEGRVDFQEVLKYIGINPIN